MFFVHLQGWRLHHFPGQPAPVPDHSFSKDFFLISSWNLTWCNFRSFPLILLLFTWEKETKSCLITTSFQVLVGSNKVVVKVKDTQRLISPYILKGAFCQDKFVFVFCWKLTPTFGSYNYDFLKLVKATKMGNLCTHFFPRTKKLFW